MKRLLPFALLFFAVSAWSDNPVPSKLQQAISPQQQAANKSNSSANDKAIPPSSIAVVPNNRKDKPVDIPKADSNFINTQNNSENKEPFIRWLTAEEWNTVFTLCLVAIGAITGGILCWQAYLLRQQIKLAREEFISTHRPKIIVRHLELHHANFISDEPIQVYLAIVNCGDTKAHSINIGADIWFKKGEQWIEKPDIKGRDSKVLKTIVGGERIGSTFASTRTLTKERFDQFKSGEVKLFASGFVRYKDANDVQRYTNFLREYILEKGSFVASDDADGEYQD